MKEQLREMSQWANQVSNADEGDEITVESENRCIDNHPEVRILFRLSSQFTLELLFHDMAYYCF